MAAGALVVAALGCVVKEVETTEAGRWESPAERVAEAQVGHWSKTAPPCSPCSCPQHPSSTSERLRCGRHSIRRIRWDGEPQSTDGLSRADSRSTLV